MKKKWILIAALIGLVLIGAIAAGPIMSDVETPKYQVLETQGNIEIRRYDPMIIAEVQMRGTRKTAVGNGFRLLADYIFGNNVAKRTGPMTAQAQPRESLKIAMTAPVQQQRANDIWQISFVMPSTYTMATLPEPANERVALKVQNSRLYAAISFSGLNSDDNIQKHEKVLMAHLQKNNINVTGQPKYAFYNPPWTLPFMRRNEVLVEIIN